MVVCSHLGRGQQAIRDFGIYDIDSVTSEDNDENHSLQADFLKTHKSVDQPPLNMKPMTLNNLKSLESRDRLDDQSDKQRSKKSLKAFSKAGKDKLESDWNQQIKDDPYFRSNFEVDLGSNGHPGFLSPFPGSNKPIPEVEEVSTPIILPSTVAASQSSSIKKPKK